VTSPPPARGGLGTVGIWSGQLRRAEPAEIVDAAAELEELGFRALWIPGGRGGDPFDDAARLLAATRSVTVAIGVVNIWAHPPAESAGRHRVLAAGGRFLLGLGSSHAPVVARLDQTYTRPLAKIRAYLDELDVPGRDVVLGALGPRMLDLARARCRGAHPYLTTVEHLAGMRERLGPHALLAPELMVVLDDDPERARRVARQHLGTYLALPNYRRHLLRSGLAERDLENGGSDRLVDAVVAWGGVGQVAARVAAFHDAGADHVCLQVLTADPDRMPMPEWRALASLVPGPPSPSTPTRAARCSG
jgi:probable F420-dependent oxidoreductase